MYEYRATLIQVVDGDTLDVSLDLGFSIYQNHRLRLHGVNTPELRSPDITIREKAKAAKQFAIDYLPTGSFALTIDSFKDRSEKYGRYLAIVRTGSLLPSLNDALVKAGLAVPYMTND